MPDAKIYVDTSRLISFYETAEQNAVQIEELQKYKASLVLPDQTITEFRRNRVNKLTRLRNEFKKEIDATRPKTVAIIQRLSAFQDLLKVYNAKREEIFQYLQRIIDDEKEDPIAQGILALAAEVTHIETTDKAIDLAHKRKLLGNPPASPDKNTLGDELIWELLLANLQNQDLIVVTGDETYETNLPLLEEEYHEKTKGRLLLVTDKISDVDKELGKPINPKLIEAEKKEEEIASRMDWPVGSSYFPFRPFQKEFDHRIYQVISGSPALLPGSESIIFGLPKKD